MTNTIKINELTEQADLLIDFAVTEALRGDKAEAMGYEYEYEIYRSILADYGTKIISFEDAFFSMYKHMKSTMDKKQLNIWLSDGSLQLRFSKIENEAFCKLTECYMTEIITERGLCDEDRKFLSAILRYVQKAHKNQRKEAAL